MTYSCTDFTDSILDALKIDVPRESWDSPADQAELALAEIHRLQKLARQMKGLERAPASRLERVQCAAGLIRIARKHLRIARAKNAADYVQRSLKSVEGAARHARGLETRANPPIPA